MIACDDEITQALNTNTAIMKTSFTLFAITSLLFILTPAAAQVKQWDADFGGDQNDELAASQPTTDGGFIFGGYSESGTSGDKTQASRGGSDYWIVKTDADGVKQWDARFGGTSVDELTCLQQTKDGGYILGGISFSGAGGDKTQSTRGSSDYWIVKTDAHGVKQWDATFGGTSIDELRSLQQTSDGGYILGGSSLSGIGGDKTQPTKGGKDFWVVKIDSNGLKQMDADFGGDKFEELYSVRQTPGGGFILGGYSLSGVNGDKTDPARGRYDFWIVKLSAKGIKEWDAAYGGKDDDWLAEVVPATGGGYLLAGWSWSGNSGDKSKDSRGANDYWIVKTDNLGVRQWDASFGGTTNDYLTSAQQTADGGFVLGGYSSSLKGGDKTQDTKGGTDYWMVKTNNNGEKQWDVDFGGTEFDFLAALQQCQDGGFVLGGYSSSNAGGDKTGDTKGSNDYWIVKTTADGVSCSIPVNRQTSNITSTAATVEWLRVPEAINYIVGYRLKGFGDWTNVHTANSFKKLEGLFEGSDYEWRVRSVCAGFGSSVWSPSTFFTTKFSKQAGVQATAPGIETNTLTVYPNPVEQNAVISFLLPKASPVTISLSDRSGNIIRTITSATFAAGNHDLQFNKGSINAGIYFLRMTTNTGDVLKGIVIE